jgi:hypothetical protein
MTLARPAVFLEINKAGIKKKLRQGQDMIVATTLAKTTSL